MSAPDTMQVQGEEVKEINTSKTSEAKTPPTFGELLAHSHEVNLATAPTTYGPDGKPLPNTVAMPTNADLGETPPRHPNEKPFDSVGSTHDLEGKPMVQVDGGFTGPGRPWAAPFTTHAAGEKVHISGESNMKVDGEAEGDPAEIDPTKQGWQQNKPA